MQLFYAPDISDKPFNLPEEEAKHLRLVLRKKIGDVIHITDGKGLLATCDVIDLDKKHVKVQVTNLEETPLDVAQVHIAVALPKSRDRIEWLIQKLTEIGVHSITPLTCDHSERSKWNRDRAEKIMIGAAKQSLRTHFPALGDITRFDDLISDTENMSQQFILHGNANPHDTISEHYITGNNCTLVIGPEGDFSERELSIADEKNITKIYLGNRRLRTETAALFGASIIMEKNI